MKAVPIQPTKSARNPGRPAAELLPEVPLAPVAPVLDIEAMCALYCVSRSVLYRGITAGHIPRARKIGGSKRWLGAEVAASLTERLSDGDGE